MLPIDFSGVDFITNVFERTYRQVLQPGAISRRVEGHRYRFAKRILLVNNVNDRGDVEKLLGPLLESGEISEFHYVSGLLDGALGKVRLRRSRIAKAIHYTDCALVAATLSGSSHVVYSDADVFMREPMDWITPSLDLMASDDRIAVANPLWVTNRTRPEAREVRGLFGIGYGFSDQLYLYERKEFSKPIYNSFVPISYRYPTSYIAPIFEQMVDSYMRTNGRLRATHQNAVYIHDDDEGAAYRKARPMLELKRQAIKAAVKVCRALPGNHPYFSV